MPTPASSIRKNDGGHGSSFRTQVALALALALALRSAFGGTFAFVAPVQIAATVATRRAALPRLPRVESSAARRLGVGVDGAICTNEARRGCRALCKNRKTARPVKPAMGCRTRT